MFGYLRLFVVVCLLVVIGLTTAGGIYLRHIAANNFTNSIEKNNSSLAQGYVNMVWKKYRDVIVPLSSDPSQLNGNAQVAEFAQDTVRYFQNMPLVRVNVYSGSGLLLMTDNISTAGNLLGSSASPDKDFVDAKLQRRSVNDSNVVNDVAMQGVAHGVLIQTLFLIYAEGAEGRPPEGMVEVLFNVTDLWNQLQLFQMASTTAVIGGFIALMFVISLSSRRAEAIITKQHEANLELAQAAAMAQAENQDKSQFLANISHELRTPLNAIIGFSDIIKMELLPKLQDRKYDQYVTDINSSGVHLLSLINDILDFSKAEAGKLALEVSEVNVTKMVQNCLRLVSPRAESANVKLMEEMPKEPIIMMVDSKKLKQVLLNLLSNAVKFTPAGGVVSVIVWIDVLTDGVTFAVEDSGIGIAPKDISRAMSPFGQVDSTFKRKYEGTGLGLPLTKKFVELMGGKFNIESEVGKGTRVVFTLPSNAKENDAVAVEEAPVDQTA